MKKILLIPIFIFTILFSFADATIVRASEFITNSASGRPLAQFPLPYIPDEKVDSSTVNEDIYEFNDNYDDAINLSPANYYYSNLYRTQINATLDYEAGFQDIDYYYFKVLTNSYITITINSTNSGLYDFYILTNDYQEITNYYAYHTLDGLLYDETTNKYRNYLNIEKPGTYYIYVRGKQSTNLTINYELNLYVEQKEARENMLLSEMKEHSEIKGAAWISDFVPFNMESIPNITDSIAYYEKHTTNLCYPEHALEDLKALHDDNPIPLVTYYIWDPLLRYDLNASFKTLTQMLHSKYQNDEQLAVELEAKRNTINNCIELCATVTSFVSGTAVVQRLTSAILANYISWDDILITMVNSYYDAIIPKMTLLKSDLISFLVAITVALELDLTGVSSREDISQLSNSETIYIPYFYELFEENGISYFSLKSTLDYFYSTIDMKYDNTYISGSQDPYCHGNIYSISSVEDMIKLNGLSILNTHTHNFSSFVWENLSTHRALCDCGETISEGHAVLQGSTTCIKCGGRANMGFIGQMSIVTHETKNGSKKIANGLIVLVDEDINDYLEGKLVFYECNSIIK